MPLNRAAIDAILRARAGHERPAVGESRRPEPGEPVQVESGCAR